MLLLAYPARLAWRTYWAIGVARTMQHSLADRGYSRRQVSLVQVLQRCSGQTGSKRPQLVQVYGGTTWTASSTRASTVPVTTLDRTQAPDLSALVDCDYVKADTRAHIQWPTDDRGHTLDAADRSDIGNAGSAGNAQLEHRVDCHAALSKVLRDLLPSPHCEA